MCGLGWCTNVMLIVQHSSDAEQKEFLKRGTRIAAAEAKAASTKPRVARSATKPSVPRAAELVVATAPVILPIYHIYLDSSLPSSFLLLFLLLLLK
jgi:hypothetical protein